MQAVGGINVAPLNTIVVEADPYTAGGQVAHNVQIQNSSNFVLTILAAGLLYTIQPFLAQTIPLAADGGSVTLTSTQNPSGAASSSTITLVWLLAGEDPPEQDGPLTAAAIAAAIAGSVLTQQGQTVLLTGYASTPTAGNFTSKTVNIPAGVHVNALMVLCSAALGYGAVLRIDGNTSGQIYWQGRPCANDPVLINEAGLYAQGFRFIVPFPGDYEGSFNVTIVNGGAATQGFQSLDVIGFEGTVPPWQPPPPVSGTSIGSISTTGTGTVATTLLPALTDGRIYLVHSITVGCVLLGSGTATIAEISTGNFQACPTVAVPNGSGNQSKTFPVPGIAGAGSIALDLVAGGGVGVTSAAYADVAYSYG
jgi:hypothetical protein